MDTKISDLTALTIPVTGDLFAVVDVSDTSMAATGTDKKLTFGNLEANLTVANLTGGTATGTGNIVRATSATLVTPILGVASATSINKVAITAPATSATLTIADGKTLTASNSITLAGTDGKGIDIGAATSGKILIGNGTNMILSTPTYPTAAGTSGNVLTSDGTNWTSATPSASGSSTSVDSTQSTYNNFEIDFCGSAATPTGDTWDSSAMNAATRWNGKLFRPTFGTNSYVSQFLPGNIGASSAFLQFGNGKDIIVSFNAKFSSASGQIGVGISDVVDAFYDVSQDGGKMMFTYNGTTLNAVNGETSETTTDVGSGITRTNWNAYKIVYTYGTDVKFYINNTLVATHTTNRPTTSNNARFGIGGATSGNTAEIANVVISIEK